MDRREFYQEIKKDPALRVGIEIMAEAMADHKKYETPIDAIIAHGEDQAHRFFAMEDFNRIVENHLLKAPLGVDALSALGKLLAERALIPHNDAGYMEISDRGWRIGASYLIGKMLDPEEVELQKQRRREESERRVQRWEKKQDDAKTAINAYIHGQVELDNAIQALLEMKTGRWEDSDVDEDDQWPGTFDMENIIQDAWDEMKETTPPNFDYAIENSWGNTVYPGTDAFGKVRLVYRPDLLEIFMPLWDALCYYLPQWCKRDFHHITHYKYYDNSILEQSFVHYLKTGNPISLRVANQMADNLIERLLDAEGRSIGWYLFELERQLNLLAHYYGGLDDDHREQTCAFIAGILERWPFLKEEIPIADRKFDTLQLFDEHCKDFN